MSHISSQAVNSKSPIYIEGDEQSNILRGSKLNEYVYGHGGDDILNGRAGNDFFVGGEGFDLIKDHRGNEIYRFDFGDGQDIIIDKRGYDKIQFGEGIKISNVQFRENKLGDLILRLQNNRERETGDQITIKKAFIQDNHRIEELIFASGTILDWTSIVKHSESYSLVQPLREPNLEVKQPLITGMNHQGTAGHDVILGTDQADRLKGLDGDDVLHGFRGNDKLEGGLGNDILEVTYGDNELNGGEGDDVLMASYGNNKLYGGAGNDHLQLKSSHGAERLYRNTLSGGQGNDVIETGFSHDTYLFNLGDGQDKITDLGGEDILRFGEGILPQHVSVNVVQDTSTSYSGNRSYYMVKLLIEYPEGKDNPDEIYIELMPQSSPKWKQKESNPWSPTIHNEYILNHPNKIESLQFSNGQKLTWEQALIRAWGVYGTEENDKLAKKDRYSDFRSHFFGGAGDDLIYSQGGDTIHFNRGDGHDTVIGSVCVVFGQDIIPSQVEIVEAIYSPQNPDFKPELNLFLLDEQGRRTGDQITLSSFYSNSSYFQKLKFADGSEKDLNSIHQTGIIIRGTQSDEIITIPDLERVSNYTILGLAGDDHILNSTNHYSTNHSVRFNGGGGNDILENKSEYDKNIYIFELGDGQDLIKLYERYRSSYQLKFGQGITQDILKLSRSTYDLIIQYDLPQNTDQITIEHYFKHENEKNLLSFSDSSETQIKELTQDLNRLQGTVDNDILIGNDMDEVIQGDKGNDTLHGGGGNDIYFFELGDGFDQVKESDGKDIFHFGQNITEQDLSFTREDKNLIVQYSATDQVKINNYFDSIKSQLEQIIFSDQSVKDMSTLPSFLLEIRGTDKNDRIYGGDLKDILTGGKGNDYLNGENGSDTYIYNLGDGRDTISESGYNNNSKHDVIQLGTQIQQDDVSKELDGDNLVIYIGNKDSDDQIEIQSALDEHYKIEHLTFADGTTIDPFSLPSYAKRQAQLEQAMSSFDSGETEAINTPSLLQTTSSNIMTSTSVENTQ
tara:strand:- start:2276 stop:5320 length:3045 start_codon:yes stop_codon:yes gene_type:complete